MKRVLCYGDSNTWGHTGHGTRYEDELQWPNILQNKLGQDYKVIQEGLRARVSGNYEDEKPFLNGQSAFEAIARSSMPAEYLILALGTNDLKLKYSRTAEDIYQDLLWYASEVARLAEPNENKTMKIIFVAPPNFKTRIGGFEADETVRQSLIRLLTATKYPVICFDDLDMSEDKLHFSENGHQRMAEAVFDKIKELEDEV